MLLSYNGSNRIMGRGGKIFLVSLLLLVLALSSFTIAQKRNEQVTVGIANGNAAEYNSEDVREKIESTQVRTVDVITVESVLAREAHPPIDGQSTIARRVAQITRGITEVFDGRGAGLESTQEQEKEEIFGRIAGLQKTSETVRATTEIKERDQKKLEDSGKQLTKSVNTRIVKSTGESVVAREIKRFFQSIGFSEGEIPALNSFNPNPLNFNTCAKDPEGFCSLEINVANIYGEYTGGGSDIFSFVVANILQPDGVTWGEDIAIFDFDYTTTNTITYKLAPLASSVFKVRIANYYKGDIFYSDAKVLEVIGDQSYFEPEISSIAPNPADFSLMSKDQDGAYIFVLEGANFFPLYISDTIKSSTVIAEIISPDNAKKSFIYPFEYVNPETILLKTSPVEQESKVSIVVYNYVDGELLASEPVILSITASDVNEGTPFSEYSFADLKSGNIDKIIHCSGPLSTPANHDAYLAAFPTTKSYMVAHDINLGDNRYPADVMVNSMKSKFNLYSNEIPLVSIFYTNSTGLPDGIAVGLDPQILAGTFDPALTLLADMIKDFNKPVFVRIAPEFNGDWNGYKQETYADSYRYIVDYFENAGVNNAVYMWNYMPLSTPFDYLAWYPGDDYVDWWSVDIFSNHFKAGVPVPNLKVFLDDAVAHNKAIAVPESAPSTLDVNNVATWNQWFVLYFALLNDPQYTFKSFCYSNVDYTKTTDNPDWKNVQIQGTPLVPFYQEELLKPQYLHQQEG